MTKLNDIVFNQEMLDQVETAHEQIIVDRLQHLELSKEFCIKLINDINSGYNKLLIPYSTAVSMKEASGGKQLSGKDLKELGLGADKDDEEGIKEARKIRDTLRRLYNGEDKETLISFIKDHEDFKYSSLEDATRACFRQPTKDKVNNKPTDLKAYAQKIMKSIEDKKFDDFTDGFVSDELIQIFAHIGLAAMSPEAKQNLKDDLSATQKITTKISKAS